MNKDFAFLVLMVGVLGQTLILGAALEGWEHLPLKESLQSEWVVISIWVVGLVAALVGVAGLVYPNRK